MNKEILPKIASYTIFPMAAASFLSCLWTAVYVTVKWHQPSDSIALYFQAASIIGLCVALLAMIPALYQFRKRSLVLAYGLFIFFAVLFLLVLFMKPLSAPTWEYIRTGLGATDFDKLALEANKRTSALDVEQNFFFGTFIAFFAVVFSGMAFLFTGLKVRQKSTAWPMAVCLVSLFIVVSTLLSWIGSLPILEEFGIGFSWLNFLEPIIMINFGFYLYQTDIWHNYFIQGLYFILFLVCGLCLLPASIDTIRQKLAGRFGVFKKT